MARQGRLGWILLSAAGLAVAGCVSERDKYRDELQSQLARDILAADTPLPVVARMQQGTADPAAFRPADPRPGPEKLPGGDKFRVSVRARVNGQPIFDDDIYNGNRMEFERIKRLPEPQRSDDQVKVFNDTLGKLIDEEVVYQEAYHKLVKYNPRALEKLKEFFQKEFDKKIRNILEQSGLTEEKLKEQLKLQGMTMEAWHKREEKQFIGQEYMRSMISGKIKGEITLSAVERYYREHPGDFKQKDEVQWQNILVAVGPRHPTLAQARQFAEQIIDRWRAGEDFNRLLQFDEGDSSTRKGEGVGKRRGEIRPREVEDYLFALREGEIGPPVEMSTGVHIFRVIKRAFAGQIPFNEEVQKTIRRKMENELGRREEKRLLQDLKDHAIIEIIP